MQKKRSSSLNILALVVSLSLVAVNPVFAVETEAKKGAGSMDRAAEQARISLFRGRKILVRGFVETPGIDLRLRNVASDGTVSTSGAFFKPNLRALTGVDVAYGDLFGIGIAGKGPLPNADRIARGKTISEDYRFTFTPDPVFIGVNYSVIKGFYAENSNRIDPELTRSGISYQAPNLRLQSVALNFIYILSPERFSFKAAFTQVVRQSESGGSWLLGGNLAETVVSDPGGIVPIQIRGDYGTDADLTRAGFRTAAFKGGYGYTQVFGDVVYISAAFLLGLGGQDGAFDTPTGRGRKSALVARADGIIVIGYSSENATGALSFQVDSNQNMTRSVAIDTTLFSSRLSFGLRF